MTRKKCLYGTSSGHLDWITTAGRGLAGQGLAARLETIDHGVLRALDPADHQDREDRRDDCDDGGERVEGVAARSSSSASRAAWRW